ncbi:MAG: response regulator [Candidatus Aerophobetes bacterium]
MKKALIVEDNQDSQFLLTVLIKSMGFSAILANNGMEAVEKAIEEKPHLILMDIMLPGIDGREATRRIRSNQETKEIPILAVTAITDKSQLRECIKAGCNDYILKPFNNKDLQEKILAVLDPPRDKQ